MHYSPITRLVKTFLRGLVTVIPLFITAWILTWVLLTAESFFGSIIKLAIPKNIYLPGLGIITAIGVVFAVGVFTRSTILNRIFSKLEGLITSVPIVKTLYGSIKDFFQFFFNSHREFSEVVIVDLGAPNVKVLGFVTANQPDIKLGSAVSDTVAVFLPMSYQLGGYTIFVTQSQIESVEISVEDALRYVLTAGVSRDSNS